MRSLGVAFVATRSPVPHWAARTWRGATPQAEGLVRARTQVCFHTPAPVPWGRSRSISPSREGHRAPVAAVPCGDQPSAHRQGGSGGGAPARPLPRQRRGELGVRRGAQHPLARSQCSTLRGLAHDCYRVMSQPRAPALQRLTNSSAAAASAADQPIRWASGSRPPSRDARPRRTRRSHESSCSVSCSQELRDLIGQQYIDTLRTQFAAN